ncbi:MULTISPECIES: GntR family transcriptional regulator [unclassified Frigoribacterium]|uniref:GntR family transcriptional regulator n=1 Tax=unclassified Frigoribacterium TaxID=2627005 RepID=UPI000F4A58D2|nr:MULTISPECIES: GntR family transcriptional regulator [unclassified Frigoribacterium]ROP75098.1 DNA-binding GntR family transcriptional regulator [Frigoribacterium sp. PhB107]TDT62161.1 DNA-binding GntR family transcriptional regulator [Frigoribacterium sp. PhB116]
MPIPKTTDQPQAPRRLLRDVVYDKMFAAIIDGTLEFGERLNDDQLVAWLGVSRTPVREAIAKLAEQALVDIEANRYTRIVDPTFDEFVDTMDVGYAVWSLLLERAVPKLTSAQRDEIVRLLDARADAFAAEQDEDVAGIVRMNAILLEAAASPSLVRLWASGGPRLLLLSRRPVANAVFDHAQARAFTVELRDAVRDGDADAAAAAVRLQPSRLQGWFDAVREAGVYRA